MDKVIYLAMGGAGQMMLGQSVHTNNLANAATPGFKSDLSHYTSIGIEGDGYKSRTYTLTNDVVSDLTHGSIKTTDRDLDVAISGDGWLSVIAPNGNEAYTRNGHLNITETGMLVTQNNLPVVGNGGPVVIPPVERVNIASDGTIYIKPQDSENLVVLDRLKLIKTDFKNIAKATDGLFYTQDNTVLDPDASVKLQSGALEVSNVNVVNEMVNMIDLSRRFEIQIKLMKTAEENDRAASDIARLT